MIRKPVSCVVCACALAAVFLGAAADGAIIYSAPGSTYSQNFDSLPNSPQNTSLGTSPIGWKNDDPAPPAGNFSIQGFYLFHPASQAEGGFDGHQRMRIGAGTANTGAFMSYGGSGSTERALGSQVSSATVGTVPGQQYIGMRLTNNAAYTLTEFVLGYDGEQWRDGGATTPAPKTLELQYSTTATAVNDTPAYSAAPALNFTTPVFVNTGSGAAVDGNAAGKMTIGPTAVTGINWLPGTDLWIRWRDPRNSGNNHGLGIDNVTFSATPEPGSMTLLLGAAAVCGLRRRRAR